jgi:hypothetical protein
MYDVWTHALDRNEHVDLVLGGNFHSTSPAQGRYDASFGGVLSRRETGQWSVRPPTATNLYLEGQVRALEPLRTSGGDLLLVAARNNAPLQFYRVGTGEW